MKNKKIILDTNLWISFLISGKLSEIDKLFEDNTIELVFSNESVEEFMKVAERPKFRKYFSYYDIEKILRYFEEYGSLVKVNSNIKICRDAKDDFLLNLSVDSKADYLVTGDKDLLVLRRINETKIRTLAQFLESLV